MPARPKVDLLPDDVRAELDARLVRQRFSGYVALSNWLRDIGHPIGKTQLHRYGSRRQRFESVVGSATGADGDVRTVIVIVDIRKPRDAATVYGTSATPAEAGAAIERLLLLRPAR